MSSWRPILALCVQIGAAGPALAVNPQAILAGEPARWLSEYGFFDGNDIARPADGVHFYDLATPLFSDRALKFRYVHVPPGQQADYSAQEAFEFPVGSALIKTFAYPADFRSREKSIRKIETRLLLRQSDGWKALAYVWKDDGSDAELKIAGRRLPVSFVDEAGSSVAFDYAVPNRNQCKGCHSVDGKLVPIGPKARNLNRKIGPAGERKDQLGHWRELGILAGLPGNGEIPAGVTALDEARPLEARARAWLDVNCAHCHRAEGPASNSGLFLTMGETDPVKLGIGKRPAAAGRGAGERRVDIAPGKPDDSVLMLRIESIEPGIMMPELGRNLHDDSGAGLIREWILSLR